MSDPRRGDLVFAGFDPQPVIIEAETPKRYRVRAVEEKIRLPFRGTGVSIVYRSGTVLVLKSAVRLQDGLAAASRSEVGRMDFASRSELLRGSQFRACGTKAAGPARDRPGGTGLR